MSAPAASPASLCCCRKSSSSGGRCPGESPVAAANAAPASSMASRRRPPADVASASNFVDFGLRHFHLDLRVNFALKEMSGWLVLDLLPLVAGARTLVLDAHPSLAVRAVDCQTGGAREPARLAFRLEPFASFGSALQIDLPEAVEVGTPTRVTVRYAATDGPAVRARARTRMRKRTEARAASRGFASELFAHNISALWEKCEFNCDQLPVARVQNGALARDHTK